MRGSPTELNQKFYKIENNEHNIYKLTNKASNPFPWVLKENGPQPLWGPHPTLTDETLGKGTYGVTIKGKFGNHLVAFKQEKMYKGRAMSKKVFERERQRYVYNIAAIANRMKTTYTVSREDHGQPLVVPWESPGCSMLYGEYETKQGLVYKGWIQYTMPLLDGNIVSYLKMLNSKLPKMKPVAVAAANSHLSIPIEALIDKSLESGLLNVDGCITNMMCTWQKTAPYQLTTIMIGDIDVNYACHTGLELFKKDIPYCFRLEGDKTLLSVHPHVLDILDLHLGFPHFAAHLYKLVVSTQIRDLTKGRINLTFKETVDVDKFLGFLNGLRPNFEEGFDPLAVMFYNAMQFKDTPGDYNAIKRNLSMLNDSEKSKQLRSNNIRTYVQTLFGIHSGSRPSRPARVSNRTTNSADSVRALGKSRAPLRPAHGLDSTHHYLTFAKI